MTTLSLRERNEAVILPSIISYVEAANSRPKQAYGCRNFFKGPLEAAGQILRNAFYLPLYKKKIDPELELNQRLAEKLSYVLQHPQALCSKELQLIRRFFSVRDIDVQIEGPIVRTFTVRLFESRLPIGEKKLRVILFSFNGNTEHGRDIPAITRTWNPLKIEEIGKSPLSVLQAFQALGLRIDSLVTTSLGNVALDGIKYFPSESTAFPPTLILNRGLTSIKKVANQLYSFPLNYLLLGAAKLCGWDANPEKGLLNFLEKNTQRSIQPPRKVVIIEAQKDFYFSGKGAPEVDIHEKISRLGVSVFRAKFWPFPFHIRSHHALSLDHLENNPETQVLANTLSFALDPGEKMSSAIARNIFLEGSEEWHTCFYIGGADATRDTGTVREIMPLLSAFIEAGERQTQSNADDRKELPA